VKRLERIAVPGYLSQQQPQQLVVPNSMLLQSKLGCSNLPPKIPKLLLVGITLHSGPLDGRIVVIANTLTKNKPSKDDNPASLPTPGYG
jgi:hypothetical protein